tara:strand:- start:1276 stop:3048 length:1773 start_codon:yes stop_codon:yes gene_type:complete
MKPLNITASETPSFIKETVDTYLEEQGDYVSHLMWRLGTKKQGKSGSIPDAIKRLLKPLPRRLGSVLDKKVTPKMIKQTRNYLAEKLESVESKKALFRYVLREPAPLNPVVSYNPDMEVGSLFPRAIEVLNNRPLKMDEQLVQAVVAHRASLPFNQENNERDKYLPLHVLQIIAEVVSVDDPFYFDYNEMQESGRITERARGAGPVNNKIVRFLIEFDRKYKVSPKSKLNFESLLKKRYGLESVHDWASEVIKAYDVSSDHKLEELYLALAWHEIESTGETAKGIEFDADTSGFTHVLMQIGAWKPEMIDSNHPKWIKLYKKLAKRLTRCYWAGHLPWDELVSLAKKIVAPCQYGGGKHSIPAQILKGVAYNKHTEEWIIPKNIESLIPEYFKHFFMVEYKEGKKLDTPEFGDASDGLDLLTDQVFKGYHMLFKQTYPWVTDLNEKMINWAEAHVDQVITDEYGFQRTVHRWDFDDTMDKVPINWNDSRGFKHSGGINPMTESSFTGLMANETHHKDAEQMALLILFLAGLDIPVVSILDAAIVPIEHAPDLQEAASRTFLEVHSKPTFCVGTEDFKAWDGPAPNVWNFG